MDERRARAVLANIGNAVDGAAILWRGDSLTGRDLDVLVLPGAEDAAVAALAGEGLLPAPGEPGHAVFTAPGLEVDLLLGSSWPAYYPSLDGVRSRAGSGDAPLRVASDADRLLMLAAEAVAGRPLEKIAARARELLAGEGAAERLRAVASEEKLEPLADLIMQPDELLGRSSLGRLPYRAAAAVATRSPAARAALRQRVGTRLEAADRRRGLLISLSGMDGSGKSTAAAAVRRELEQAGVHVDVAWARFGQEADVLDRVAGPVRKLLRRTGTTADPVAAGGPTVSARQNPRAAAGRRGPVGWAWVVVVAAVNARSFRRLARPRKRGVAIVCDRWAADSLVDLELRYGRHRLAEWLLSRATPRPDLAILLEIDAGTAATRKPGDQAERVLRGMEEAYARRAAQLGLERVDATRAAAEVAAEVVGLAGRFARRPLGK
jgi:thymidylate kinase